MHRPWLRLALLSLGLAPTLACAHRHAHGDSSVSPTPNADVADEEPASLLEFVGPLEQYSGLLDLWVDHEAARVYVALDRREPFECLYVEGLAAGLGANPVGLDRGEIGPTRWVRWRVVGDRALLEALNPDFRASTGDEHEQRATARAFPTSVLWSGPVVARQADGPRVLVDLTELVVSDAHGVARSLRDSDEGEWSFDRERSVLEPKAVAAFPDNVELEALVTFTSEDPGPWAGSTPPADDRLTLRQHHSFVRLPDDGFRPRRWNARMGQIGRTHLDFSAPLHEPLAQPLIIRHRLHRDRPLVYYVDRGTPEPIRSALIEGASWWAEAFAAAGFPDGFRVELLPADADPMDVRYNMIHWVHRSTRGWSFGSSVVDPRTGEIVRGSVTLGSQRVRQDRRIFEALVGAADSGRGGHNDPVQLALARVRQLAAHEVGHTLGFEHNFAASTYGRASVMDYPAPWVHVHGSGDSAALDLSEVYGVGLGEWDRTAFEYSYREWDSAQAQTRGLQALVDRARAEGLLHLSDDVTHAWGAAHPEANVWDNGSDAIEALREVMAVRAVGLRRFGPDRLAPGAPPESLELTFAPLYFFHRYQLAATAKLIGGQRHAVGSDATEPVTTVDDARQREALEALLETITPEALAVPAAVVDLMRPTPQSHIDELPSFAGPVFDPDALAAAAAGMTMAALLDRHRAHRLELFAERDDRRLGFAELLDRVHRRVFDGSGREPARRRAQERVREVYVDALIELSADPQASARTRALADSALVRVVREAQRQRGSERRQAAGAALAARAQRWLDRTAPTQPVVIERPSAPPGSPIGSARGCGGAFEPWPGVR